MSVVEEYNAEYDPAWVGAATVEARKEEFERKDDPLSDNSDKIKDALAALLTLGAVVAYCSGPAGAAVGAAMPIGAGIVTALKEPPKSDSDLTKLVHSVEAMQINKDIIETTDSNQKGALKAASRLAAAAGVSCLLSTHSIRCRIYAWLALDSKAHGKLDAYKEYRASFTSACSVMQKTANEKRKEINNMISTAAEQRANMIKGPTFDFKHQKWSKGMNGPATRSLRRLIRKRRLGFWPTTFMNAWIFNKETTPPKAADDAVFYAKARARQYAWLSAHPTRVVMELWNCACKDVKLYIYPQMKSGHKPERIREETIESPHPWICDARTVQWAYKLRTEDGTSELSDWSDEYTLPSDLSPDKPAKLPVLKLEDFGFPAST